MLKTARHGLVSVLALAVVAAVTVGLMASTAVGASAAGRGYELVSPPDKNGGDITADSQRTRASVDGDAVAFISLTAFGDAIGTSVATDYMAVRASTPNPGSNGWATHAISPPSLGIPIRALVSQHQPAYEGDFTDDLSTGVFTSWGVLGNTPEVGEVSNLYRRADLRSPGAGFYELVSSCALCIATDTPLPVLPELAALTQIRRTLLAGMSPDGGHIVFETVHSLTSDAATTQAGACDFVGIGTLRCRNRVYEWDNGTVRLVGVLPNGSAADTSLAGDGVGVLHINNRTPHVVSDGSDGHSRIFFTQPTNASGLTSSQLAGAAHDQVNRGFIGNVYVRIDGAVTEQINASERTTADTFAPARFLDASVDGTRVIIMTREALTNDAPIGTTNKLYMYDASRDASEPDNLTLMSPDAGDGSEARGILGASDDGRYVYMLVTGQLEPGEPALGNTPGIYLWHDGVIDFIGSVPVTSALDELHSTGSNYILTPRQARVTPDGRHLLFSSISGAGLTGENHGSCDTSFGIGCRQFYVYSADTQELQCASCRPDRVPPRTMATSVIRTNNSGAKTTWHETNTISDDGRHVFFSTAESLVPEDANGRIDAYEFDTMTGTPRLLSSGRSTSDTWFMDASADGQDAFFLTRERLVGWDVDGSYDLYDARVGGGFPEPVRTPPGCAADDCQGPPGLAPAIGGMGTSLFRGAGDVQERLRARKARPRARRCRRGFVKKRVRGKLKCVKRTRTHRARRAHASQRRGS